MLDWSNALLDGADKPCSAGWPCSPRRSAGRHNRQPDATAIVDRPRRSARRRPSGVLITASAFAAAECPYQRARTLVLAGGDERHDGLALLAELGVAPPPLKSPT